MAVTRPEQLANFLKHMALQSLTIFGFTLMEDDPPILHITAGLATLKRCDTVLAKGSDFNQKGEADIGRHRLRRSSASDRVDQRGIIGVRTCRLIFLGWLASIHHSIGTLTRCIDTWLCNGFASMVSAWLGICNVSCYTYMNASNGCHSAKTTGQFCIARGFAMASHHWF